MLFNKSKSIADEVYSIVKKNRRNGASILDIMSAIRIDEKQLDNILKSMLSSGRISRRGELDRITGEVVSVKYYA